MSPGIAPVNAAGGLADRVERRRLAWDAMHRRYFPDYDRRWQIVLDQLRAHAPAAGRVLDAGCGPGTLTCRIAAEFPALSVVGVEADPLLVGLARAASDRVEYLNAAVGTASGDARCAALGPYEAIVSSAFVHYFHPSALLELLRTQSRMLAPHGVLITAERFASTSLRTDPGPVAGAGPSPWERWWAQTRADPDVAALGGRATAPPASSAPPPLRLRRFIPLLREAGFDAVSVVAAGGGSTVVTAHRTAMDQSVPPASRRWHVPTL